MDQNPTIDSQESKHWELIFPIEFFKNLCESCSKGIVEYFAQEDINPYEQYKKANTFGEVWTEQRKLFSKSKNGFFKKVLGLTTKLGAS